MENNLIKNIEVTKSAYYSLKKNDYLQIAYKISLLVQSSFNLDLPADISISVRGNSCDSTYCIEEFQKYFSANTQFHSISITAYVPQSPSYIAFHMDPIFSLGTIMNSNIHTLPQIEDLLQELIDFIYPMYISRSEIITNTTKANIPDVQISTVLPHPEYPVNKQHCHNSCTPTDKKTSLYKSGVFWAALGTIFGIGTFIVAILQIFP